MPTQINPPGAPSSSAVTCKKRRCDAHVGVSSSIADFGQDAVPRQCVPDERVSAVMNHQHLQTLQPQRLTGSLEAVAVGVADIRVRYKVLWKFCEFMSSIMSGSISI
ncbi:hypothetical protein Mal52_09460 [Symmachiella dynata]|uniref:Uncharacterized protein n=1 Tax=Symmachiella dynata TaxID=2527995 RepID=A0A517ZJ17_9PLAN|nr:hypothetical protein Mal52_09460 [Symmachiella dynata]